jgi:hypothetical protein
MNKFITSGNGARVVRWSWRPVEGIILVFGVTKYSQQILRSLRWSEIFYPLCAMLGTSKMALSLCYIQIAKPGKNMRKIFRLDVITLGFTY